MRYIVIQKGVTQFAMNFFFKSDFLLFKEEGLTVCYEPTLSQVSGRGYFPYADLMTVLQSRYIPHFMDKETEI